MSSAIPGMDCISLPAPSQDSTVAVEHNTTVVIKVKRLRDLNQNKRSRSQYPDAPKAEPAPRTSRNLKSVSRVGVFWTLSTGTNNHGENIVSMLKAPTSVTKLIALPIVTADLSRSDMTTELAWREPMAPKGSRNPTSDAPSPALLNSHSSMAAGINIRT
jgi:hypothetical protein